MSAAPSARPAKQFKTHIQASAVWAVVLVVRLVEARFLPVRPATQAAHLILEVVVVYRGIHAMMLDVYSALQLPCTLRPQ